MRTVLALGLAAVLLGTFGCGGGGGSSSSSSGSSGNNVIPLVVNAGPANNGANMPYVSVTLCVPGTSTCQTLSDILVDTGSIGLRVLSSVISTLPLPEITLNGVQVANCGQYADGSFTWGSMRTANVTLGGETASNVQVQVVGDLELPSSGVCSNLDQSESTPSTLKAYGILGVGPFVGDDSPSYFTCPSTGCVAATVGSGQELQNPVALLSQDNNGVVIQFPAISSAGAPSASGSLILGIGTQSNNGLGSARVVPLDVNGRFSATFNAMAYPSSVIDSGSNTNLFLDPSLLTNVPACQQDAIFTTSAITDFYCPSSTTSLAGTNGSGNVPFTITVANAKTLFCPSYSNDTCPGGATTSNAFNDLAGPSTSLPDRFDFADFGLPFFYGRSVFTAIDGRSTPGGTGPYVAY